MRRLRVFRGPLRVFFRRRAVSSAPPASVDDATVVRLHELALLECAPVGSPAFAAARADVGALLELARGLAADVAALEPAPAARRAAAAAAAAAARLADGEDDGDGGRGEAAAESGCGGGRAATDAAWADDRDGEGDAAAGAQRRAPPADPDGVVGRPEELLRHAAVRQGPYFVVPRGP